MPNIRSAKTRVRNSQKKAAYNKIQRSELKTVLKKARVALADENTTNKNEVFAHAQKTIDQAAAKGLIHKNQAANKKSGLSKLMAAK